jgi:enoyl-CoA hydratase/carnithine racemase
MGYDDIGVELDGHVALIEMRRPPNNFLDVELLGNLATILEELDRASIFAPAAISSSGSRSRRAGRSSCRPNAIPTRKRGA